MEPEVEVDPIEILTAALPGSDCRSAGTIGWCATLGDVKLWLSLNSAPNEPEWVAELEVEPQDIDTRALGDTPQTALAALAVACRKDAQRRVSRAELTLRDARQRFDVVGSVFPSDAPQ